MPRNNRNTQSVQADITESFGDGGCRSKNVAAERKIIACCFHRKPELQNICSVLTPEDFSDPRYKVFFKYIQGTYTAGKLPDVDVAMSQAQRSSDYDIEPEEYLEGLKTAFEGGTDCDVEAVCHEIHDLYVVRRILGLAGRISANVADGQSSAELVGNAEESLRKLTGEVIRENTLMNIDELIASSPLGIGELTDPPMDGIPTPWPSLNEYIYGWRPGQVAVIGARPGAGKSIFLVQAFEHAANMGKIVCLFSHEMSAFDLWTRIVCNKVGIKSSDIMHRQLTKDERGRIADYIKHAAPRNLIISDRGGKTILSMRSELARLKAKFGQVDMVGVDYLQLMESPGLDRDRVQAVGAVSRGLKRISMEMDTRMVVAAQLNRMVDNRPGDNRPKLSDLRESGAIEQDADICILLDRPSMYKKMKEGIPPPPDEFIIAKQRRGRTGIINMKCNGEHYKFQEIN